METKEYFEKEMFFESLRLPLDKISCTRQFESKLSLRSFAKSLDKGSSTSQPSHKSLYDPFGSPTGDRNPSRKGKDVTALRCSEPLRSKVGGPKRSSPWFCGLRPPGGEEIL